MSMITCRNLLIYMTPALQKRIFNMLLFGLKSNGYLFLGPSENPIPIMENLELVHAKFKIYKNSKTSKTCKITKIYKHPKILKTMKITKTFSPQKHNKQNDTYKQRHNNTHDKLIKQYKTHELH